MTRYQTVRRPCGPLTAAVLVKLLAELGEIAPRRKPRPYTRNAHLAGTPNPAQ